MGVEARPPKGKEHTGGRGKKVRASARRRALSFKLNMADLRVFVSSTCYDLGILREQLRVFLQGVGHQPVMSEYSDVLYDPRNHTHTSCLKEIAGCDIAIVVIGGRFGGGAVPEALSQVDFEKLKPGTDSGWILDNSSSVSITQLEVLRAIQDAVPVFAFIEEQVWHDHLVYEKNKTRPVIADIAFPSIDKPETAKYIFEFINFLRHRTQNNSLQRFARLEDIVGHLKRQWSALFQRLLFEQRHDIRESRTATQLGEQLESLRAAVLSSIKEPDLRDTARGVVKYRRIVDFVLSLRLPSPSAAVRAGGSLESVLSKAGVVRALEVRAIEGVSPRRVYLVRSDGTLLMVRMPLRLLRGLKAQWDDLTQLPDGSVEAIVEAWKDMGHQSMFLTIRRPIEELSADSEVRELALEQIFSESDESESAA